MIRYDKIKVINVICIDYNVILWILQVPLW